VRDQQRGAVDHERLESALHEILALGIERRGGFVEKQYARVAQQRARNCQALLLPAAELGAALAAERVVAVVHGLDECVRVGGTRRRFHLFVTRIRAAEADVLAHAATEENGLLRHQAHLLAEPPHLELPQVHAIEHDHAAGGIVEPLDELDHRALAAARLADQRHRLTGRDLQRDPAEHLVVGARGVREAHVS